MREIIYNPRTRRWHIIDRVPPRPRRQRATRISTLAEGLLILLLPELCLSILLLLYIHGPAIDQFFTNLLKAILSTTNN